MADEILELSNTQAKQLAGCRWRLDGRVLTFMSYDPNEPGQPPWKSGAEGRAYPLIGSDGKIAAYIKFFTKGTQTRFDRTQWLISQRIDTWSKHLIAAPSAWVDSRRHFRPNGVDFDLTGCVAKLAPGDTWLELKFRLNDSGRQLPAETRWRLVGDLIVALSILEKAELIHGDLSPNNILVDPSADPQTPSIHLIDFDAFSAESIGLRAMSVGEGGTYGTLGYCPPDLDRRTERGDLTMAPYSDRYARDMLLLEFLFFGAGISPDEPPSRWNKTNLTNRYRSLFSCCPPNRAAAIRHLSPDHVFDLTERQRPKTTSLAANLDLSIPTPTIAVAAQVTPNPRRQTRKSPGLTAAQIQPEAQLPPVIQQQLVNAPGLTTPSVPPTTAIDAIWQLLSDILSPLYRISTSLWHNRQRQIIRALLATAGICLIWGVFSLHKALLTKTTLSFTLSVDGAEPATDRRSVVTVDGKPFLSGNTISLGEHQIEAHIDGAEPFRRNIWAFYGAHELGTFALESSKGSLSVQVTPSPATINVLQDGKLIRQGAAPMSLDGLPVGQYLLSVRKGDYVEDHVIEIDRQQRATADIHLNLGNVALRSNPPDAEFELSGSDKTWRGKLPTKIEDAPAGVYKFSAQRKGWGISEELEVKRGELTNGQLEFPYGAVILNSTPADLDVSIDDMPVGRTPLRLTEQRPGKYKVAVTDGENELSDEIVVDPKKTVERAFTLRTGAVQISSSPLGATVLRNGRVIGKTPLTRGNIACGDGALEIRLNGFSPVTLPIVIQDGRTTAYSVRLIDLNYLSAMADAQKALEAQSFPLAIQDVESALRICPGDADASALLAKTKQLAEQWKQQQLEAKRIADEAKAKQLADAFAAIPILKPDDIIERCWNTPSKQPSGLVNLGDVAQQKGVMAPVSVPIWAVTDLIVLGIKAIPGTSSKAPRFNWDLFRDSFKNRTYRYLGKVARVENGGRNLEFAPGGIAGRGFVVIANLGVESPSVAQALTKASSVWVSGRLTALEEDGRSSNLVLDDAVVYSPEPSLKTKEPSTDAPVIIAATNRSPQQEVRVFVKRDIHEFLRADSEIGSFPPESRVFEYDYKEVWAAVLAEAKVGGIFESIGPMNEREGWIYAKDRMDHSYVESDYYSQAHPSYYVFKRYVALVTDTGAGIEVQAVMKIYLQKTWTDYQGVIQTSLKLDPKAYVTTGGVSVFLDGVQSRLHHRH